MHKDAEDVGENKGIIEEAEYKISYLENRIKWMSKKEKKCKWDIRDY